ncbi:hypothetical protein F5X99DRAFT_430533 [Biscogniauxia marginata]|nr:hypothetical protein F5X99DRAFT_430533 [Biscogniauxia marginata]
MSSVAASYDIRVSDALSRKFPTWESLNVDSQSLVSVAPSILDAQEESFEFYMSTNWILSPEALDELYDALHEELENLEVIFDPSFGGFKIRCLRQDEEKVIVLAKKELDRIVTPEFEKGLDASTKVGHITDWRDKGGFTPEQLEKYDKFMYPYEVAHSNYRGTWNLPDNLVGEGVSTRELLPGNALSDLQQLTGATVFVSFDGSTVYIGAESEAELSVARRKLDTLAFYFSLPLDDGPQFESFLYSEDKSGTGADVVLHYLSHVDKHLLKTYYLDRADYRSIGHYYKVLFEKGVVVRQLGLDKEQQVSTAAVDEKEAKQPFTVFSADRWQYKVKEPPARQRIDETPSVTTLSSTILDEASNNFQTNRNPLVESWVTHLPNFKPQPRKLMSNDQDDTRTRKEIGIKSSDNGEGYSRPIQQKASEENYRTVPTCKDSEASSADFGAQRHFNARGKGQPSPQSGPPSSPLADLSNPQQQATSGCMPPYISRSVRLLQSLGAEEPVGESKPIEEVGTQVDETPRKYPSDPGSVSSTYSSRTQDMTKTQKTELSGKNCVQSFLGTKEYVQDHSRWATNDPFANIWQGARSVGTQKTALERAQPQLRKTDEKESRSFRSTMRQQAGSRRDDSKSPQSELVQTLNEKLVKMMSFLRIYTGLVSLKVDLGRLCFTKINPMHVQLPGPEALSRCHNLQSLQDSLNKRHVASKDVLFTKILTTHGGEADFIANLKDSSGQRIWSHHTCRTIYEVTCVATTEDDLTYSFTIDFDGATFEHNIRPADSETRSLAVHFMEHSWDFRVVLCSAQDLEKVCKSFAKDLAYSMRIIQQRGGPPVLEFINKSAYRVKIHRVRTRNIASYTLLAPGEDSLSPSSGIDTNILEISEVWDMKGYVVSETEEASTIKYEQSPGNQQAGEAGMWYEATIQSSMVSTALTENRDLEFGDEATWSAEEFQKAGAFDNLIRTAVQMVKSMDGIGYWGDNFQDALVHGMPPSSIAEIAARKRGTSSKSPNRGLSRLGYRPEYW